MKVHEACAILDAQYAKREKLHLVVRPGELEFKPAEDGTAGRILVVPFINTGTPSSRFVFEIDYPANYTGFLQLLKEETNARIIRVYDSGGMRQDGSINGVWCAHLEYSARRLCTALYNAGKLKFEVIFLRMT